MSGRELAQRAYEQAWLFGTEFVYANEARDLRADGDRRIVTLSDGTEVAGRAVVLATGVSYRRLGIASLERLVGAGVYYGAAVTEADAVRGAPAVVVGGGNSAGQAAVHLAAYATTVTLLVRGPNLAESMSDYLIRQLTALPNVEIRFGVEVVDGAGGALERVTVRDRASGVTERIAAAAVYVLIGAEPRTDWLSGDVARDAWGFVLTGEDVGGAQGGRRRLALETSMGGVFAVGDVRHRSVKRVASAVGEGSIAIASSTTTSRRSRNHPPSREASRARRCPERRSALPSPYRPREGSMDDETTELTDDQIVTAMPGAGGAVRASQLDTDGGDADGTDADGTDGDAKDGTDGDAKDADGTDGDTADATDGDAKDADGTDAPS